MSEKITIVQGIHVSTKQDIKNPTIVARINKRYA